MAWIQVIDPEEATGPLKEHYNQSIQRTGKVWNIVSIMGQNPAVMEASMNFYKAIMFGPSELSRAQREMLATVVSAENHCVY